MTSARDEILANIRNGVKTDAAFTPRYADPQANVIPAYVKLDHQGLVKLFLEKITTAGATVDECQTTSLVSTLTTYLDEQQLYDNLVVAEALYEEGPLTANLSNPPSTPDKMATSITPCLAAIAETGTLACISSAKTPSNYHFLPETHIAIVYEKQIVASYEDAWQKVRALPKVPRTVNFITGPSRTGDIEQTILLGIHGPKHLHIILVRE